MTGLEIDFCLLSFLLLTNYFVSLPFFFSLGARAEDVNVCPKEMVELYCPPLEPAIRNGDYRELIWKVADPGDKSEREIGYCDEKLSCTRYNSLGNFEKRITIDRPVNGTLYVEQRIKDDLLTFTCSVQRKHNKDPLVYQVNVSSSVNCKWNLMGIFFSCFYFYPSVSARTVIGWRFSGPDQSLYIYGPKI